MKISYSAAVNSKSDLLICPYFEDKKSNIPYETKIKKHLDPKLFKGKAGETLFVSSARILFLGLGKKSKLESVEVRNNFAKAAKGLLNEKYNKIAVHWHSSLDNYVDEILEGILLVNHTIEKYKTGKALKKAKEKLFDELTVVAKTLPKNFKKQASIIVKLVDAVHYVRDLVTGPPNIITVDYCANEAKKIARANGSTVKVHDKAWLQKMKMGAILGVNAGSGNKGAKLVVLDYKPKKLSKKDPIIIIGKGLIFDSGGYNLKPTKHIEDMQQDMAGGAVVFGLFKILKELGLKRRVIGIVPLTENMIDSNAQRPSDIVTAYNGKTIEIRNTDAEGRLILADALAYGVEQFKPEYTIDIATLTGACIVALGDRYAGLIGNDEKLNKKLIEAGKKTDELLWELPLHKDFSEAMKGLIGDLRNADNGTSYLAGTSKAGSFLQNFVDKAKWAHLDIAGTAYVQKPHAVESQFGTGFGVRILAEFLKGL
ncbi:M17 family metallopeptidase [Patescibacteria group bacterium]